MTHSALIPRPVNTIITAVTAVVLTAFPVKRAGGIAGLEGTFEFGLDAPWRIEPNKKADGTIEYGAIPIQISIHDAHHSNLDNIIYPGGPPFGAFTLPDNVVSLGKFYSVRVKELSSPGTPAVEFSLNALHELEASYGDWPWPSDPNRKPFHKIVRIWKGEDPEPFRDVSQTSEWHATLYYVPQNTAPGAVVALQIEVLLQRRDWPPEPLKGSLKVGTTSVPFTLPFEFSPFITLRNYVRVYLAPDPLPRFDNRWLYGDLHYHSQGTDNEGESGYNYRGVIRAMGAMGLDFLFATEHASNSEQIIDADLPPVHKIPEIAHSQGDKLTENNVRAIGGVLRDMDVNRFASCHELIYGTNGANREASFRSGNFRFPQNYNSYGVVPQIFLGGELDAVPELKISTVNAHTTRPFGDHFEIKIPYGNGLLFDLGTLCSPQGCIDPRQPLLGLADADSVVIFDFQSLESFQYFGRGHLVYFPNSSTLNIGGETTFIPSHTSRFGGATRRLYGTAFIGFTGEPLLPEVERKGVVFVAHHLNASGGSRGPDGVPWTTDHMLLKAFRSPAVLGLEFWNENIRNRTSVCSHDFCKNSSGYSGVELGYERNEKLEADSNNPLEDLVIAVVDALGGNLLPSEFHKIALPLEEVRRGFITGDQNGSLFELTPFDIQTGLWQDDSFETEHVLNHGAYDWDMLNLRGLDFEANADLTNGWLQPGEPRRMFMAGGSDAHGDLNYRRAGYFLGTDDANDTAIGKPRNLVFAGTPQGAVIYSEGPSAQIPDDIGANSVTPQSIGFAPRGFRRPPGDVEFPIIDPIVEKPGTDLPIDPPILEPPIIRPPINDPPVLEPPIVDPPPPPPVTDPPVNDPTPVDPGIRLPDDRPPITDPPVIDPGTPEPPSNPPTVPPIKIPIDDRPSLGLELRAHSQEQIIRGLRNGRFCVTDGPAIRIAIDTNGNDQIDDSDIQMGDVYQLTNQLGVIPGRTQSDAITILTEVISTPEFGAVMDIDLYIGVHPSSAANLSQPVEPRVYAPLVHGPGRFKRDTPPNPQFSYESNGRIYLRQPDSYWQGEFLGDAITWNQVSGNALRYSHTLVTRLHLDKYQVGKGITANRFFVRAFTRTGGASIPENRAARYAYSNPIWILRAAGPVLEIPDDRLPDPTDSPAAPPTISAILNAQGELVITFTGTCTFSPRLDQPFEDIPGAVSPYVVRPENWTGFFRARK